MSPSAAILFGSQEFAVYWGFAYMLGSIVLAGGIVGRIRGAENKHDGHAIVALAIGGALLGILMYVGTTSAVLASK